MPKLDLTSAIRMKNNVGEISALKGAGFSWSGVADPYTNIGEQFFDDNADTYGIAVFADNKVFSDDNYTTPQTVDGGTVGSVLNYYEDSPHSFSDLDYTSTVHPTWDSSEKALTFDGSNDKLVIGINPNNHNQTLMTRFKSELGSGNQYESLIGCSISSNRSYICLNNGRVSAGLGSVGAASFVTGSDLRSDGLWHTLGLTWIHDGDMIMYLDGVEVLRQAKAGLTATYNYGIGCRITSAGTTPAADMNFKGSISHVLVGSKELTATQILDIHNGWT